MRNVKRAALAAVVLILTINAIRGIVFAVRSVVKQNYGAFTLGLLLTFVSLGLLAAVYVSRS
jgi:hypothetical protein